MGIATRVRNQLVLAQGENPGAWIANALELELEHAGARVQLLPAGTSTATGLGLTGEVALLTAEPTGSNMLPGLLSVATGMGYEPHIRMNLQLHEDGVLKLNRQYDIQENVPSDALHVWLVGRRPHAFRDVPAAFGTALKKLIREQVLPDLAHEYNEATPTSAPVTPPPAGSR